VFLSARAWRSTSAISSRCLSTWGGDGSRDNVRDEGSVLMRAANARIRPEVANSVFGSVGELWCEDGCKRFSWCP
jgi:hypothetical protein